MKKFKNKIDIRALFVAIAVLSLLLSCSKDSTGPKEEPPQIPPSSSFLMNFEFFTSQDTTGGIQPDVIRVNNLLSYQNWGYAGINVLVWNTFITVGLAVPVGAFLESFRHEPEQQSNGKWLWSYSFKVFNITHTAKLYGSISNDGTEWQMFISKAGVYSDFLWYEGSADLPGTHGTWTVYNTPDDPTPLLLIEWHRDVSAGTADIKYTNIVPDGPENGGYIFYGVTNDVPFDAFYDIYNKGQDNHTLIEWNRLTKAGRVQDENHFGDTDWHCWNEMLEDVDCPQ